MGICPSGLYLLCLAWFSYYCLSLCSAYAYVCCWSCCSTAWLPCLCHHRITGNSGAIDPASSVPVDGPVVELSSPECNCRLRNTKCTQPNKIQMLKVESFHAGHVVDVIVFFEYVHRYAGISPSNWAPGANRASTHSIYCSNLCLCESGHRIWYARVVLSGRVAEHGLRYNQVYIAIGLRFSSATCTHILRTYSLSPSPHMMTALSQLIWITRVVYY